MNMSTNLLPLIARILIASAFVKSAIEKCIHYSDTIAYLKEAGLTEGTNFFLITGIVLLLLGSLLVITGFKSRLGATLLVIILIPSTLLWHDNMNDVKTIDYLMHNGVYLGALLLIISFGSGGWSWQ